MAEPDLHHLIKALELRIMELERELKAVRELAHRALREAKAK